MERFFARKFCLFEDFEGFPATKRFACCFSNYAIFIHFGMLCEFFGKSSVCRSSFDHLFSWKVSMQDLGGISSVFLHVFALKIGGTDPI